MRLLGAVVMLAGMVWLMLGCGSSVEQPAGRLVLKDADSGTNYELALAQGSLSLTDVGASGSAEAGAALTDGVTGTNYDLGVRDGALTLEPGERAGAQQIALSDTVTSGTSELAVANGALVLTPETER